ERDRAPAGDVEQADDFFGFEDRFPAEQHLHALEQGADAALAVIGNGRMPILGEGEFLVLGAEPESRLWPDALLEPADEIVTPLDRRHVDLITSHAGVPAKTAATLHAGRKKRKPAARRTPDDPASVRNFGRA